MRAKADERVCSVDCASDHVNPGSTSGKWFGGETLFRSSVQTVPQRGAMTLALCEGLKFSFVAAFGLWWWAS